MADFGLRVSNGSGVQFSTTDRITHHLYHWTTTTTTSETKTIPAMADELDVAVIISSRSQGCGGYSWEKLNSTQIKITWHSASQTSDTPSADIYVMGY